MAGELDHFIKGLKQGQQEGVIGYAVTIQNNPNDEFDDCLVSMDSDPKPRMKFTVKWRPKISASGPLGRVYPRKGDSGMIVFLDERDPWLVQWTGDSDIDPADGTASQSALDELEERVEELEEDTDWLDFGGEFINPWTQYDTPGGDWRAQYRRRLGLVHIRGLVKPTTNYTYAGAGTNLSILTMPVGFRPGKMLMGEGYQYETSTQRAVLRVDMAANGLVRIAPTNDWSAMGNGGFPIWLKLTFPPYIAEG